MFLTPLPNIFCFYTYHTTHIYTCTTPHRYTHAMNTWALTTHHGTSPHTQIHTCYAIHTHAHTHIRTPHHSYHAPHHTHKPSHHTTPTPKREYMHYTIHLPSCTHHVSLHTHAHPTSCYTQTVQPILCQPARVISLVGSLPLTPEMLYRHKSQSYLDM